MGRRQPHLPGRRGDSVSKCPQLCSRAPTRFITLLGGSAVTLAVGGRSIGALEGEGVTLRVFTTTVQTPKGHDEHRADDADR